MSPPRVPPPPTTYDDLVPTELWKFLERPEQYIVKGADELDADAEAGAEVPVAYFDPAFEDRVVLIRLIRKLVSLRLVVFRRTKRCGVGFLL